MEIVCVPFTASNSKYVLRTYVLYVLYCNTANEVSSMQSMSTPREGPWCRRSSQLLSSPLMLWLAAFFFFLPVVLTFVLVSKIEVKSVRKYASKGRNEKLVSVEIPLGKGYKSVLCNFRPLFYNSKFITVTYPVPFELSIDKPPKNFPAPIVNKSSQLANGEQEGT